MLIYCDGSTTRICFVPEGRAPQVIDLPLKVTSNQGEYLAILKALRWAYSNKHTNITILSDSQLVVNQITRRYATKNPVLLGLGRNVWGYLKLIGEEVKFIWIPREENKAGIILG